MRIDINAIRAMLEEDHELLVEMRKTMAARKKLDENCPHRIAFGGHEWVDLSYASHRTVQCPHCGLATKARWLKAARQNAPNRLTDVSDPAEVL